MNRNHMLYIEEEIKQFKRSLKEIERLKRDIIEGTKGQCNDGSQRCGTSDPTASTATALMTNKQIQRLQEVTGAIEEVLEGLNREQLTLVKIKYWKRPQTLTWDGIALELNVSRSQAIRWRNGIVREVGKRLGIS